jgi:hypothetical protein
MVVCPFISARTSFPPPAYETDENGIQSVPFGAGGCQQTRDTPDQVLKSIVDGIGNLDIFLYEPETLPCVATRGAKPLTAADGVANRWPPSLL